MPPLTPRPQLFILSPELSNSISMEEVEATFADMKELGIASPPYEHFELQNFPVRLVPTNILEAANRENFLNETLTFEFLNGELVNWRIYNMPKGIFDVVDNGAKLDDGAAALARDLYKALIVLLVSKGVEKIHRESKLAKLGIGKPRSAGVTTIRLAPYVVSDMECVGTGLKKRPHLRRGHIRQQRYGTGLASSRAIFIEPCFVNADEGWIGERTAYKLR